MSRAARARAGMPPGTPPLAAGGGERSGGDAGALALPGERWVAAPAVRRLVGAWAYTRPVGVPAPTPEMVRAAVGVAQAIAECATDPVRARWQPGSATPSAAVPESADELAARSGHPARVVAEALALLANAQAVVRRTGSGEATVALAPEALGAGGCAARLDWPGVRARVTALGASVPPALAVLRELASRAGPAADDLPPPVRASVRDLEDATGFGRSTVADALAVLERAALLGVEVRAGRTTRLTLLAAAFGIADGWEPARPVPTIRPAATVALGAAARAGAAPAAPGTGAAASAAEAAVPVGSFAGIPIHAPPGTPVVVERDAAGRWLCRVGPFLVLGPVDDPG